MKLFFLLGALTLNMMCGISLEIVCTSNVKDLGLTKERSIESNMHAALFAFVFTSNSNRRLKSCVDMSICVLKRGDLCIFT